jgi:hypothetical protein
MALPTVIVVLLILTASFAGGVALTRGERLIDDAGKAAVFAQSYAETGLQRVVSDRAALGLTGVPGASDSTRVTFAGGYYDVVTTQLRANGTAPGLYFMRSHAVITKAGTANAPSAEYTVTQLGIWMSGSMTVQSALTGINGTTKNGGAGAISGVDQCPVASGGTGTTIAAVAGPAVAADGGAGYKGSLGPLTGNPQVQTIAATPAAAAAAVHIDWPNISTGAAVTPDFVLDNSGNLISGNAATWVSWTSFFLNHPTAWPVILVQNGPMIANNNFSLPSHGQGMLIIQDDLTLSGSQAGWNGVLLVGGSLTSNGTNIVQGATVTGLNDQIAGYVPTSNDVDTMNGTKQYLYDSCNVKNAVAAFGAMRVYKNTWSNIYKTY